ncbi:MAG: flagellar biosynthetic protein FliO [Woeseiaceae bacterium]|nr:flagellar biosynthetic protein FliO [Woeseiaceae bacterium]
MRFRVLKLIACAAATTLASYPAQANKDPASLQATPGIGGGDILSLGLSLIIVVCVIVALGWFYSRSRFVSGGGADLITVVATRALGPRERLMVVEVADQQILIGMTSTSASTLHVLEKPLEAPARTTASGTFASRLKSALLENRE